MQSCTRNKMLTGLSPSVGYRQVAGVDSGEIQVVFVLSHKFIDKTNVINAGFSKITSI